MKLPMAREADPLAAAVTELSVAAGKKKCWSCGCFHGALLAVEKIPQEGRPPALEEVLRKGRPVLLPVRHDCLGCEVCHPAVALNALEEAGFAEAAGAAHCAVEAVVERAGWPTLPGDYRVLRYRAPVAVCTLTDADLAAALAREAPPSVGVVGTLHTENLGIERVVRNVVANPHLRFLVVCGADSRGAVGHLPGQSLLALAANGVDEKTRILGARGRRPVLANIGREEVEHFRRTIEVIDLVGVEAPDRVLGAVRECAVRDPGPAEPLAVVPAIAPLRGYLPERAVQDPSGFFVVYVEPDRGLLCLEHYQTNGMLDAVLEGTTAAELYHPAIERGLVSRLDHAAYLGRELARAELALRSGTRYVQDAAPESAPVMTIG